MGMQHVLGKQGIKLQENNLVARPF